MPVEREKPAYLHSIKKVKAFLSILLHLVEIVIAPVLCESLRTFNSDTEIQKTLVTAIQVTEIFSKSKSVGKAVVPFFVFFAQLRNIVFVNINPDFMLKKSGACSEKDPGVFIRRQNRKQLSCLQ